MKPLSRTPLRWTTWPVAMLPVMALSCAPAPPPPAPPPPSPRRIVTSRPASRPVPPPEPVRLPPIWFDQLPPSSELADVHGRRLVRYAAAALGPDPDAHRPLPEALRQDQQPRVIFLSAGGPDGPADVVAAGRRGIVVAVDAAVAALRAAREGGAPPAWLKLDVVARVRHVPEAGKASLTAFGRGRTGLAMSGDANVALLPDELVPARLSLFPTLEPLRAAQALHRDPFRRRTPKQLLDARRDVGWPFTTVAWFCRGDRVVALDRGHRTFPDPTAADALQAAKLAGLYLTRAVGADGQFDYLYEPTTDKVSDEYNILRHAGTIYAMMELYEVTRDAGLRAAAERAIQYLLRAVRPCPTVDEAAWVVERGQVKLGGNALAIVALAEHARVTGVKTHLPTMESLARWIVSVQKPDGRFAVHKLAVAGGKVSSFRSGYYPGEAILALLRLHALRGGGKQGAWLDAARRSARYLILVRDAKLATDQLPPDHWLLYGLNELFRFRDNPLYPRHARRIGRSIRNAQIRHHREPDLVGGYGLPTPGSTPAATRTEGLTALWGLLEDLGHLNEARDVFEAIRRGVRFQLRLQYRPESAMYFPSPSRCIGAFRESHRAAGVRIDYVQHNLSALLAYRRILLRTAARRR